ncbi:DEAD/DEAH box helicase [Amaricoccus sp.]|uniref:DEAD/DEAH box helicase n=1 Tax=Amaricoccus sp. TaxID=1872485 RepID=UPI001B3F73A1|nr:DEAD/DEAH box helicase [Amaricoccus sp.]MBP7001736.1 DEAD/DEAH box helicase [Amaricoccus sp.]
MISDRVPDALGRALARRGYQTLTPVQRAVLEAAPPGRDMLVSAPTGSGKTVAFGLALAGSLLDGAGRAILGGAPRALVVTPTRELAQQVAGELAWLYGEAGARVACCVGGTDLRAERARLAAGCEVVVGSPGRLRDHAGRRALELGGLACVVLDEADDMLQMGFREDLDFLMAAAGPERRTLMFSATLGPRIEALAAQYQREAARIDAGEVAAGGEIRFEAAAVAAADRAAAVANLLRFHEAAGAMVFCARRDGVAELAGWLGQRGFRVVALSGDLAPRERAAAVAALREGRARVCVATDLAARGLDLPGVELVIHADLPASAAALTHRSGRTGRAGRGGHALLLAPPSSRRRAAMLAARAGVALDWVAVPDAEAILARDEARLMADAVLVEPAAAAERDAAARLLAAHDPERVAVAFLRERARARPAPEALGGGGAGAERVWFAIDRGRAAGVEAGGLVRLICRLGGVDRAAVGRIRVREHETAFEIAAGAAERFAAAAARAARGAAVAIRRSGPGGG